MDCKSCEENLDKIVYHFDNEAPIGCKGCKWLSHTVKFVAVTKRDKMRKMLEDDNPATATTQLTEVQHGRQSRSNNRRR